MRLYRIDPPGTWLQTEAVFDLLKKYRAGESFLEIGCGDGRLSQRLLARGFRGVGLDLSDEALAIAQETLKPSIESGRYSLQRGDVVDVQRDS